MEGERSKNVAPLDTNAHELRQPRESISPLSLIKLSFSFAWNLKSRQVLTLTCSHDLIKTLSALEVLKTDPYFSSEDLCNFIIGWPYLFIFNRVNQQKNLHLTNGS